MTTKTFVLGDVLDYVFGFRDGNPGPWLQPDETIAATSVEVIGPLEQVGAATVSDGDVTVWVRTTDAAQVFAGGSISVQITTSQGRKHTERLDLSIA